MSSAFQRLFPPKRVAPARRETTSVRGLSASRFARCRSGASAVEFALVAPMFFALTFSILEAGYFFFVESAVDAANAKAARLIRTGQAQSSAMTQAAFFDQVCKVVDIFGDCNQQLTVEVERFATFSALAASPTTPTCRDAAPDAVAALNYQTGASRDIVRVRICYLHKSFNPGLGMNLEKAKGGKVKMISTTIFRTEPYGS